MNKNLLPIVAVATLLSACAGGGQKTAEKENATSKFSGAKGEVKLMTLDPGHFHAALIQKSMYDQIDPTVYVFAPEGTDVTDHLARIEGFNTRAENPTSWIEKVYTLSLIHISEPTRLGMISYAVFCLKKKKTITK